MTGEPIERADRTGRRGAVRWGAVRWGAVVPPPARGERWEAWWGEHAEELDAFDEHLSRLPYLGLAHPLGRRLRELVHGSARAELAEHSWFRGREPEGARRFTSVDLLPPPPRGAPKEGRFNHLGQSVFYLSSSPECALAETIHRHHGTGEAWLQEFRIEGSFPVLDLTGPRWWLEPGRPLLALAMVERVKVRSPDRSIPWKPEYFVPRFVADCAKEAGFKAIHVESSRAEGTNLTLFDWSDCRVDPIGAPELRRDPAGH